MIISSYTNGNLCDQKKETIQRCFHDTSTVLSSFSTEKKIIRERHSLTNTNVLYQI